MPTGSSPQKESLLVQVLRKIPIFKGLSPSQVKRILGLCVHRQYEAAEKICQSGTPPDEMFILLTGEVSIATPEGLKVATILPVTTVGEMGVITGQARSATAEATSPASILIIQKAQFDAVLKEDVDMQVKVYRAIIDVLADKLNNDNTRLRDYQMEKRRYEGRLAVSDRKLEEQRRRLGIAIEIAAAGGDMATGEIELLIKDRVKDMIPRVLVVDDEADFRALIRDALPTFEVVEAKDGREAMEVVQEETLDFIITDIRMPGMDGIALLEYLRAQHPELPVLAASGYMDAAEIEDYDFDGFVEKPLSLEALQDLVDETVAKATG